MIEPGKFLTTAAFALLLASSAMAADTQQCDLTGKRIFSFDTTCGTTGCAGGESLYFVTKDKILEYIPQSILDNRPNVSAFRFNGRENVGIVYTRENTVDALEGDVPVMYKMRSLPVGWRQEQTASSGFDGTILNLEFRSKIITAAEELFGEIILYSQIEISNCNSCRMVAKGTYSYSVERYNEKSVIADVRLRQNHWCRLESAELGEMPR